MDGDGADSLLGSEEPLVDISDLAGSSGEGSRGELRAMVEAAQRNDLRHERQVEDLREIVREQRSMLDEQRAATDMVRDLLAVMERRHDQVLRIELEAERRRVEDRYEQSSFWRVSGPVRRMVDLVRRR